MGTSRVGWVGIFVAAAAACSTSSGGGSPDNGDGPGADPGTDAGTSPGSSGGEDGSAAHEDGRSPAGQGDGGVPAPPIDAGPCATRSGQRGLTTRKVSFGGIDRNYIVYLPQPLDPTKPVPLVLAHHGWDMSADEMRLITDFTTLADSEGFAVVFPEGESGPNSLLAPWNCGANVCPTLAVITPVATGDDLGFLDVVRADVQNDQCIDPSHVFVTGFSMGGYFSHHVGCMKPDVRAVAPHSGGTHDLSACPVAKKPIILFHGDQDDMVPDGCDDPNGTNTPAGFTPSATAWAKHNGCGTTATTVAVQSGECRYYDGCPADGQVAVCILHGMKHCWAGGPASAGGNACPGYASATTLEWQFFKKYAW